MNDKLQTSQNLNLRLQAQLEQAEQQTASLFEFIAALQKESGLPSEKLDTQALYNRVCELASKETSPSDPEEGE